MFTKLSIVVPFYKSPDTVDELYNRLVVVCTKLPIISDFELIWVEDCSDDSTWGKIIQIAANDTRVKAARFSRNMGQHYAITAGVDIASGDWIVVMDCDLQDRPEEIPRLLAKASQGYDIVFARRGRRKHRLWKRVTSRIFHIIFNWLSEIDYDPEVANFSIISRKVANAYKSMRESCRLYGAQIQWLGFNIGYIDVKHGKRFAGESSYTLKKLVGLASDSIITFSNKPLRLSIHIGFFISFLAFVSALFLACKKFIYGVQVDGWTSLMVSLWFIGGLILTNLGIMGIYLGTIFNETKHRPLYIISQKINF